jgi:hypothetical protein
MTPGSEIRVATVSRRAKTSYEPSLRSASNALIDGLVSAGIYVLVAIPVDLAFTAYRIGGWTSLFRQLGLPETLGRISAQFTLLVILVSVLAFLRQRAGTARFILLDWKWWVIALALYFLPARPIVNWIGASLIYQSRERRRRVTQRAIASR